MRAKRARIERVTDAARLDAAFREEVRRGLSAPPRSLPSKYFYDARGSRLFSEITRLPEYYLTRAETALLDRSADRIATTHPAEDLVELGPGDSRKTRILLGALRRAGTLRRFVPVDVSAGTLRSLAAGLAREDPGLEVHGIAGEFEEALDRLPAGGPRIVAFLGSTLGNFDRMGAIALLRRIASVLAGNDRLLLGVDLVKEVAILEAAYNDAAGVTARFNRNLLAVVNRRLAGDFRPRLFDHVAFFNQAESRIEMHLRAGKDHHVRIPALPLEIDFRRGETIHTENSAKYEREGIASMLAEAGLSLQQWITDPDRFFALAIAGLAS